MTRFYFRKLVERSEILQTGLKPVIGSELGHAVVVASQRYARNRAHFICVLARRYSKDLKEWHSERKKMRSKLNHSSKKSIIKGILQGDGKSDVSCDREAS